MKFANWRWQLTILKMGGQKYAKHNESITKIQFVIITISLRLLVMWTDTVSKSNELI
jgi:hypothetical protein